MQDWRRWQFKVGEAVSSDLDGKAEEGARGGEDAQGAMDAMRDGANRG